MSYKKKVPTLRAMIRTDGNVTIPKRMRDMLGMKHRDEVILGVFEVLKHGEISELPLLEVSFG